MLPLKEIIYHGVILRTSSARHTLAETHKYTQDHVNSSVNNKESTGEKNSLKKKQKTTKLCLLNNVLQGLIKDKHGR